MNQYRILIVEDDIDINHLLKKMLEDSGYKVTSAFSGSEAKLVLMQEQFDLLLLDLMLPGVDGETLISFIREKYTMPIIVISAKLGTDAKITTLRLGADDFISKPFDNDEVMARVEAQLRRSNIFSKSQQTEKVIYQHKNCVIDTRTMIVKVKEQTIDLTALEYQLLLTFFTHPEQIFTRQALFNACWKQEYLGTDNTVDVHISRIRNKLSEYDSEEYIRTVRGIGYRLSM